jgi:hypothetical protein
MAYNDDLERYETTEARNLLRLFATLRSASPRQAPAQMTHSFLTTGPCLR